MSRFAQCTVTGLDTAIMRINDMIKKHKKIPEVFLTAVSEHAAQRSKVNAPILTGKLRHEIIATYPMWESATVCSATVWSSTKDPKTGFDYAYYQHEFQIPSQIPPPRSRFFRTTTDKTVVRPLYHGDITAAQPMTPEGGAGGKYIERSVMFNVPKYQRLLRALMRKVMLSGQMNLAVTQVLGNP